MFRQMEKLIELLNEYSELRLEILTEEEGQPIRKRHDYELEYPIEKIRVISKQYGFIEWLVKNNKIYEEKIPDKFEGYYYETREYVFDKASILLMELAIRDNPIEFLVSILK